MKIILVLFLAINGQAEPMVRQFEQESIDQCLSNLNRFMTTRDMIERADVTGIAAMCQATKAPEKEAAH